MKILFFSPRDFWPANTGAKLRDYHLASQLASRARVTYLGFSDSDSDPASPEACAAGSVFEKTVILPRDPGYTAAKLALGLAGRVPVTILNYTTRAMKETLATMLSETAFDAVQLESVHLAEYLPLVKQARNRPKVLSDWHNIESELMRRYSEKAENAGRRWYARVTAARLEQTERRLLEECDTVFVASERERRDVAHWDPRCPVHVIENGVDTAFYHDDTWNQPGATARKSLVYVGSMDYHANVDAVQFFVRDIWPALHAKHPELEFTIVGRNPGPAVRALESNAGVRVTGSVPDVRPYYRNALASVVPLRVGGGTRLKILESMAASVPVISTRLGAEGLKVTHSQNILLAENAAEFLASVGEVRSSETRWRQLAEDGRTLARSLYDWSAIGQSLYHHHQQLLSVPVRETVSR